jgi:hypothetical protein
MLRLFPLGLRGGADVLESNQGLVRKAYKVADRHMIKQSLKPQLAA